VTGRVASTFLDLSSSNRVRIAEGALLILLVTMAITTLVAARITRPLHALAQGARKASGGDLTARVNVHGRDEIGLLADAFNDMAEQRQRLEEQRRAMVSDVAHELRTPVSNIRGWLEATEDGLSDPAEALSSVHEEALLLEHLINDLQDLAAADAGQLVLHLGPVDPGDLVDQVAQGHRGTAEATGVTIAIRNDNVPFITADSVRLRQAVANLTTNAIRHTPAGGTVTLAVRRDGDYVVIEVADTGPGIDPQDLPFVFDRFWRADKSRNRQTGGSGLGLAIARKLAEAHQGTACAATSETGAIFSLRLPVAQANQK
jgi:two-component system sensor histidine kinase BaeS